MDSGILTVIYGFLGIGGLTVIWNFVSSHLNKKAAILDAVHKITTKHTKEKIDKMEGEQNTIQVKLKKDVDISKQSKEKIKNIQLKAATEIEEILKEEKVNKIHKEVEQGWENI